MKRKKFSLVGCLFLVVLLISLTSSSLAVPKKVTGPPADANIPDHAAAEPSKIYVLNPLGIKPAHEVFSLAPRFDTLNNQTIYIVCVGWCSPLHYVLTDELQALYPNTEWIAVNKYGTYFQDDPALWDEIKNAGAGAILHTGH